MGASGLKAFLFGVVTAAAIGPIALLIMSTAARRGLAAGAWAGLGAALADLIYALVAFTAGAMLLPLLSAHGTGVRQVLSLVLVAVALHMAWQGLSAETPAPRRPAAALLPTLGLTLVNPLTLVIFAGFVPQLPVAGTPATAVLFALALFAGSLAVQLALALAGWQAGRAAPGDRWRRGIDLAAAAGVLGFGLSGLAGA